MTLKPAPVTLAAEILTLDPPVFDTVSVCVWLPPTVTVPRFMLLGAAVRVPGVIPVPLSDTFTVGLEAFELMASVELNAPAAVGVNETVKFTAAPGDRV